MKRIPFIIIALYPYAIFLAVISIFISPIIEKFSNEDLGMALGLFLMPVVLMTVLLSTLAIAAATVYHVVTTCKCAPSAASTAGAAMKLKLIHIPAYIANSLLVFLCLSTVFTLPFSLFLFVFNLVTVFSTGTVHLTSMIAADREGKQSTVRTVLFSILGYIFVVDVITSVITARRLNK